MSIFKVSKVRKVISYWRVLKKADTHDPGEYSEPELEPAPSKGRSRSRAGAGADPSRRPEPELSVA